MVASAVVIVRLTTGLGPDLPGEELGLTEPPPAEPCSVDPADDLTPVSPRPAAGKWRDEDALPLPRNEVRASTLEGRVYAVGAQELTADGRAISSGIVHSFEPATGEYESVPDVPAPVDHAVVVTHGDHLYLVGGAANGAPTNAAWRYSPGSREWQELAPMQVARYAPAGAVIGHRLYVVGGAASDTGPPFSSMEIYDFKTGEWLAGPEMPTARHHHSAAALEGELYVAGGREPADFSLDTFERFDPETGEWED